MVPQEFVLISTISLTIDLIVLGLLFFSYYLTVDTGLSTLQQSGCIL